MKQKKQSKDQWNEELVLWENNIDKFLSKINQKKEKIYMNKLRCEKRGLTTDTKILSSYF